MLLTESILLLYGTISYHKSSSSKFEYCNKLSYGYLSTYRNARAATNQTPNFTVVPAELKIGGDIVVEFLLGPADNVPVGAIWVLVLAVG